MPLYVLSKHDSKRDRAAEWMLAAIVNPDEHINVAVDSSSEMSKFYLLRCGGFDTYSDVFITKKKVIRNEGTLLTPEEQADLHHEKRLIDELPYDIKVRKSTGNEGILRLVHITYIDQEGEEASNA